MQLFNYFDYKSTPKNHLFLIKTIFYDTSYCFFALLCTAKKQKE